ncbi:MAG TPA: NTP transferase domain-containing protein [Woeseiaceae bacterium]|nr:NTP transferase domain-containing protein [Woeseiaceae bacterium]
MSRAVYGLVLAGGESRRMGRDKALLDRGGRSQLAYMVDLLGQFVDSVFVSARPEQADDAERSQYELIVDRYRDLGPIAGILTALREHPEVDWLVVACDLPNIDAETLQNLLAHRDGGQYFTAYESSYDQLPEPLCAIYHCGCADVIQAFVDSGINCPRKILIRSDTFLLQQVNPLSLDNINTPEDLEKSVLQKC